MAKERTIVLRGEPVVDEQIEASAAITPGDLVEIDSGKFRRVAADNAAAAAWFALERDELGRDIDKDYAANDRVKVGFFAPGHRVLATVNSGEDLALGAMLHAAAGGRLKAGSTNVIARAAEASAPAAAHKRVAVIIV